MSLEVITVPSITGEPPKGVIVFLHGWGANAQDLAPLSQLLNLPDYQFLFPNAPFPHPYVSTGRMWYNLERENQGQGLAESRQLLMEWLQSLESTTAVPLSRTILSGFSQGGAMTLDVGLTLPLAGLTSLSGYLHPMNQLTTVTYPPVLLVHGRQDYVVPLSAAISAREQLMQSGVAVQYHEFEMGHEIRPEAIPVIRNFVVTKLSGESKKSFLN
ncbi:alpha/beta hydrolase [Gloeocapsopsis crepidinum LEGE 06123]|uniref:Alpha/beta hydrolase n=1 Tax=Gloeocapsopsis crepidinum LEGE 06123 TaxID=588587 RepID=A0ABR9ULI0_9CHRO|nr:alpha/beta hydrolase [Gloeocapsopsis crepidinum]MBE9189141.1 alpha/beta hydrolase [Gloeocapsopsis crepidinum LEGE 06123]